MKNAKRKKGHPTTYDPKFIDMVDDYLAECTDEVEEFHKTRGDKSDSYERIINVNIPKIEGFAQFIGSHKDTLYEWAKHHKDFSDALDKIRTAQHNRLVDNGLAGVYNPVITKLMLSNNHGYVERKDVTTDGKSIKPDAATQEQVDKAVDSFFAHGNQGHPQKHSH